MRGALSPFANAGRLQGFAGVSDVLPAPPENVSRLANTQKLANSARSLYDWPFPWEQMPPDGRPVNIHGAVQPAAAYGDETQILQFEIPFGSCLVLRHLMHTYIGTGWTEGTGDVVFTIDVDRPANESGGWVLGDYYQVPYSYGSPANGPWPVPGGLVIESGIVRYKGTAVANVSKGANDRFVAALKGWLWNTGN